MSYKTVTIEEAKEKLDLMIAELLVDKDLIFIITDKGKPRAVLKATEDEGAQIFTEDKIIAGIAQTLNTNK